MDNERGFDVARADGVTRAGFDVAGFDVARVRAEFPLIQQASAGQASCCLHGEPANEGLIYLDNAATMQRPAAVTQAVRRWGLVENGQPLRGLYELSVRATEKVAAAREAVAKWMGDEGEGAANGVAGGAVKAQEVIFTRGATEALNMAAMMLKGAGGRDGQCLSADDEIIVGVEAHHSNLLPWMELARKTGAHLKVLRCDGEGAMSVARLAEALTPNTRVVAVTAMSNVTGADSPVAELVRVAHEVGAVVVVDAAQAAAHGETVECDQGGAWGWGADLVAWSGHKIGAPMGVGVLWGRREVLERMRPVVLGGEMVEGVSLPSGWNGQEAWRGQRAMAEGGSGEWGGVTLAEIPQRFEAGTLNMDGIVGLMAAVEFWSDLGVEEGLARGEGWRRACEYVDELTEKGAELLTETEGVTVLAANHGIMSFQVEGVHPHDVAEILSGEGIAVRAGYHCAQPLLEELGWGPVVRASLAPYNTMEELKRLAEVVAAVRGRMGL